MPLILFLFFFWVHFPSTRCYFDKDNGRWLFIEILVSERILVLLIRILQRFHRFYVLIPPCSVFSDFLALHPFNKSLLTSCIFSIEFWLLSLEFWVIMGPWVIGPWSSQQVLRSYVLGPSNRVQDPGPGSSQQDSGSWVLIDSCVLAPHRVIGLHFPVCPVKV